MDQTPPGNSGSTGGSNGGGMGSGMGSPMDHAGHTAAGFDGMQIAWIIFAVLAVAAIVAVTVWAVRRTVPSPRNPLTVLDMRLANGEIDTATHARLRAHLMSGQPSAPQQPAPAMGNAATPTPAPTTEAPAQTPPTPAASATPEAPASTVAETTQMPASTTNGDKTVQLPVSN